MDPVGSVQERIQAIRQRIQQIRELALKPPGQTTSASGETSAATPAGNAASTGTRSAATGSPASAVVKSSTVNSPEFQKLLQEAIALGAEGSSGANAGGNVASGSAVADLQSGGGRSTDILGLLDRLQSSGGVAGNSSDSLSNGTKLQQYQSLLLQALKKLEQGKADQSSSSNQ